MFEQAKYWNLLLYKHSDKVYQLLAHGRWFSPGTPASSTTKSGRHDIAEILLKVALKHQIKTLCQCETDLFQIFTTSRQNAQVQDM
jgi:hypothetical protein